MNLKKELWTNLLLVKKKNIAENLSEGFISEQEIHQKELEDNEIYNKMIITKVVIIMFKHVM